MNPYIYVIYSTDPELLEFERNEPKDIFGEEMLEQAKEIPQTRIERWKRCGTAQCPNHWVFDCYL